MAKILLCVPMRNRLIDIGVAQTLFLGRSRQHEVDIAYARMTILPSGCNSLLVQALNRISHGYEWFAMLHDDVEPAMFWLDTLIEEAEKYEADFVSAAVPFKDGSGFVSTAIARPDSSYGTFTRLTLLQIRHQDFPETFGLDEAVSALARLPEPLRVEAPKTALLANTGCMVYRLSKWQPGVKFANEDEIVSEAGEFKAVYQSEDYFFSRRIAEAGGKVMVTRKVMVTHHGTGEFTNAMAYGRPRDAGPT